MTENLANAVSLEDIDNLPVSDTWKERFKAIHKAGGAKRPNIKALPPDERKKASGLNLLAFLFGPLYYLSKGMWRKGITLTIMCVVILFVLELILKMVGLASLTKGTNVSVAVVFGLLANTDYYRKMVLGENRWW